MLALPLLAVLCIAIRLDSTGPAVLRQTRVGCRGRRFEMLKLRTMMNRPRDLATQVSRGHAEVTRVGRVLRRLKLDELVQLVNVLRGEMSLVGPRPMLPTQLTGLDPRLRSRLIVKPGMTGLAQVRGNASVPWPTRWEHDFEYVSTYSPRLDGLILLKTLRVVACGERRPGDGHTA